MLKCGVLFHTLLHVLGSCCWRFETGQTFSVQTDATIPKSVGSCWPTLLRRFSRGFDWQNNNSACASRFCTFLCCHCTIDYHIKMFKGSTIWLLREGLGGYEWFGLCDRITRVICWFSFFPWHIRFFSQHCSPLKIYFFQCRNFFFSPGIFPSKNCFPRI